MKTCRLCEYSKIPDEKFNCPSCGAWSWGESFVDSSGNDGSIALEDVKNADEDRITTGIWDPMFGGGVVRSAIILIGGFPGAGKSTMLLMMAEVFSKEGECLYVASEEDLPAIKARAVRLGIKSNRKIRMVPAMGGVADIGSLLMHRKPAAVIVDSINGLVGQDSAAEIKALEVMKKFAVVIKSPVLVISQVNKGGDYSGLMAKQHAVDCLMTLSPNEDIKTPNGEALRTLEVIKNRHGRAYIEQHFEMTEKGLVTIELDKEEPEENDEDE